MMLDFPTTGQQDVILLDNIGAQCQLVDENSRNSARFVRVAVGPYAATPRHEVVLSACCQYWQSCFHIGSATQIGF